MSACVGTSATPPASGKVDARSDQGGDAVESEQARRARRLAQAVYEHPPPTPPADPTSKEAVRFMGGPLKQWFTQTRERILAAVAAYRAAIATATPEQTSRYALEVAKLHLFLVDSWWQAFRQSISASWTKDVRQAFLDTHREAMRPYLGQAAGALEYCVAAARKHAFESETVDACRDLVVSRNLTVRTAAHSPSEDSPSYPASQRLVERYRARKHAPTRVGPACDFSGSFNASGLTTIDDQAYATLFHGRGIRLFARERDQQPFATLHSGHVERVVPPAKGSERFEVALSYPVRGSYWVASDAAFWSLEQRVDVVKHHLWLEAGARVAAVKAAGAQVKVWHQAVQPAVERPLACRELSLGRPPNEARPPNEGEPSEGEWAWFQPGPAALFKAPGTAPFGSVEVAGGFVSKRQGDWVRMHGREDFGWQGWLEAQHLAPPRRAPAREGIPQAVAFGLLSLPIAASHTVTSPIDVHGQPDPTAPVVATLATGALLRARTKVVDGFLPVSVYGLTTPDTAGQSELLLYVDQAAFAAKTSSH